MPKKPAKKGAGGGITARQAKLVKILSDPSQADRPADEICQELGISRRTLNRWKATPAVREAVQAGLRRYIETLRPYALQCLKERMKSDTQALKLFFELDRQLGGGQVNLTLPASGGGMRLAILAAYSDQELEELRRELKEGR